ncbi:histidine kinase [Sphingobium sp. D43FB]|nr:histidine kinase [Sphingobium sp. D43FB]
MATKKVPAIALQGNSAPPEPPVSIKDAALPLLARGPPPVMPVVAIGASAGGLDAACKLIGALPVQSGMTFIIVQHLDPTHESLLGDLLAEHTMMKVTEATDGRLLLPNEIYIIPPARYLSVRAGALHLSAPQAHHGARLPFDFLIKSLAETYGPRTACIILSGTGSDGSLGIAELKAKGGFIIAQKPEEAEYDGMPRSAIDTGLVDAILPVQEMPEALEKFGAHIPAQPTYAVANESPTTGLAAIVSYLKDKTSHDFRQYKPGTLERRIERRMALLSIERGNLGAYHDLLRKDPAERELLAKDLLINVTSFFRDPKVFETLAKSIIPDIIKTLPDHQPLRIWAAGCSTGEEAYSIAMVCRDAIAASNRDIKLQVFASDVDPDAIATAREGLYSFDISHAVTADRIARFFVKEEVGYRVATTLRGDVVFTVQDILSDPPFSRIDLVSCRNLLIYLNPEAQAKVIALFHFALREGGILLLGSSETVGNADGRFETISKDDRIYRHAIRSRPGEPGFPLSFGDALPLLGKSDGTAPPARQSTLADICRRAVLASHAPAAVLINRKRQCLYSLGPTDRYLRIAPGYATLDLLAMATPALRTKLRLAIDKASKAQPRVDAGKTRLTFDGKTIVFDIDVQWLPGEGEDLLLVCFVEDSIQDTAAPSPRKKADATRVAELERELEASQAELQTAIENQETSSQEQKAINEEALSVNEEFQSTNEELLTSKEELQSLNEELSALNSQLQETLERQRLTSDDLQNVLYSTNVGTLFLDMDLNIRFFTPAIKLLFNVIPGDVGRPLADLHSIATDNELLIDARKVLQDEAPIEREVSAPDAAWFVRRIFPYRAHDNRVEGVVITFADITERKLSSKALEAAKLEAERANLAKSRFLAAASHDLRQPLQSLTLLQSLLAQTVEGEKPQKLIARLDQTLGAMSGMLNALLDINQIEAGVVEAHPIAFPVAQVLDRLRDEFAYMAQARGLSLHILPSSAMIESDPALLEQMVRNLLGNALKYTKRGKILLGCRHRGPDLRIELWDTGVGIAEGELHAIFEEFHQVGNEARERSQGLGLGLSIVQRLGHLLGHAIDVRSQLGKGSVFAINVPCLDDGSIVSGSDIEAEEPEMSDIEAEEPESLSPRHRCKIVIVDDDPDVLELLEELLKTDGHIVRTAVDAPNALKLIAAGAIRPEILLTDYNLPNGVNGLALLKLLRDTLQHPLPAIILTGDISSDTLAKIAAENCIQLSKPVKPSDLTSAIERLVPKGVPLSRRVESATSDGSAPMVYVVDDDPEIRASIRDVLEGHDRTVADFGSAEAFLGSYRPGPEGCLLIDAHLPGMSGLALLDQLRTRGDHLPAILITGSGDIGLAVEAMKIGACDFIEKPVGRLELLASIGRAINQSRDIRIIDAAQEIAAGHVADLTSRQREVMDMVLAGHPSKNIAADLGISQRTVENHRAAIMHKMEAKSLPELARSAQAAAAYGHQNEAALGPISAADPIAVETAG